MVCAPSAGGWTHQNVKNVNTHAHRQPQAPERSSGQIWTLILSCLVFTCLPFDGTPEPWWHVFFFVFHSSIIWIILWHSKYLFKTTILILYYKIINVSPAISKITVLISKQTSPIGSSGSPGLVFVFGIHCYRIEGGLKCLPSKYTDDRLKNSAVSEEGTLSTVL